MSFSAIYITTANEKEAAKIADHLLHKKMVACANIFPIKSAYWWQSELAKDDEVVCLVKTIDANWEKVKREVSEIHSYDTPCIMRIKVEANDAYEDWIRREVQGYGS